MLDMSRAGGGNRLGGIELRGMTWQHRRAIDPLLGTLEGFRARYPGIGVAWDARPLAGFEFTPVAELAERYDLIILDHPFAGDIAASRCLLPLDELVDEAADRAFVGPSLASYRHAGHVWALPVDAATQVAVYRADLLALLDGEIPATWDEMFALGKRARDRGQSLAVGLKGVHALMTFFTLCASQGRPCGVEPEQPFVDRDTGLTALAAMRRLLSYCPPQALDWNSIALHDAMVERDDLVYCPAVYCYATYAEADNRRPLAFANLPGLVRPSPSGSTIGGTGIGVSARTMHGEAAFAYVRYLMEAAVQREFARHHGQPAHIEAWRDESLDRRFGGCFGNTLATMEQAWIRPRYAGYLRFQAAAGDMVEAHLRGAIGETVLLDRLAVLHARAGAA
jgi:multiple sugar transport system substrate-binding protein